MPNQNCSCQKQTLPPESDKTIDNFYRLRNNCSALQLTIPEKLIENHRKFVSAPPDNASHCSIPFKAFQDGCLADFTKSIHRFALDTTTLKLTTQYKNDLRETWVLETDELSRYKKSRLYQSRLAELHFANWLECNKWEITNLEMYGGDFDAEGSQNNGERASFEIKYLGQRELVFELINNSCSTSLGTYSPIDYLLFRIYEASLQLRESNNKKIAVAIVEDYALSYELPLKENWIDWKQPAFLKNDSEMQNFLDEKYKKNPLLDSDLIESISKLDEIWVLRYVSNFELHREQRITIP